MSKYTELITNYHATKPLFFDHIDLSTRPLIDGQVSVDGINDNAMKQKIEDVLSKYSDDLMDIYFSMDSEIQALSDKEKYLLQAAVDVEKFLYKATGGSVSLGDLSVENATIHGLPKTLDDLLNNPGDNLINTNFAKRTFLHPHGRFGHLNVFTESASFVSK